MCESGIYQILNIANGHRYIGSAVNRRARWTRHRSDLRHNRRQNSHLQAAWNLYGEAAFAFTVLEHVPDREQLTDREDYWFGVLKPEYNIALVAGSQLGLKHTAEARARMSAAQMGMVRGPQSDEHRRKIGEAGKGRVCSEATKQKMSASRTGKVLGPPSAETKRKISEAQRGENGHNAKLTEKTVLEIKVLLEEGVLLLREIADRYGVSQMTISNIKRGKAWARIRAEDQQ